LEQQDKITKKQNELEEKIKSCDENSDVIQEEIKKLQNTLEQNQALKQYFIQQKEKELKENEENKPKLMNHISNLQKQKKDIEIKTETDIRLKEEYQEFLKMLEKKASDFAKRNFFNIKFDMKDDKINQEVLKIVQINTYFDEQTKKCYLDIEILFNECIEHGKFLFKLLSKDYNIVESLKKLTDTYDKLIEEEKEDKDKILLGDRNFQKKSYKTPTILNQGDTKKLIEDASFYVKLKGSHGQLYKADGSKEFFHVNENSNPVIRNHINSFNRKITDVYANSNPIVTGQKEEKKESDIIKK
jgi:hypothetical protein